MNWFLIVAILSLPALIIFNIHVGLKERKWKP